MLIIWIDGDLNFEDLHNIKSIHLKPLGEITLFSWYNEPVLDLAEKDLRGRVNKWLEFHKRTHCICMCNGTTEKRMLLLVHCRGKILNKPGMLCYLRLRNIETGLLDLSIASG